jgi:DNA-binding XRE family transcriptional regulator
VRSRPLCEYDRLRREAGEVADIADAGLPPLPKPDKKGRYLAPEFARVSLARDLIRARTAAGLSQQQLASLARVRQETISRLETAKFTARPATVDKIMAAIESARKKRPRSGRGH